MLLLLEVTGCKFAREQRWATLCDITIISTYMHAVWACLYGEEGGLMLVIFIPVQRRHTYARCVP